MAVLNGPPYRISPLYQVHQALGARWVEIANWRIPDTFVGPEEEAAKVREAVGVQDVSPMGKLELRGREVKQVLPDIPSRPNCSILQLTPRRALILTSPGLERQIAVEVQAVLTRTPVCAHLTDVTGGFSAFALVGPTAVELLRRLTPLDIRSRVLPDGACVQGGLAGVPATLQREDWGRLPAYRVLLGREYGEYGWDAIQETGAPFGLVPFGLATERLLRRDG